MWTHTQSTYMYNLYMYSMHIIDSYIDSRSACGENRETDTTTPLPHRPTYRCALHIGIYRYYLHSLHTLLHILSYSESL